MNAWLRISVASYLLAITLDAAPPRCKTLDKDGSTLQICERTDVNCDALAQESLKNPSDANWDGCAWPVTIVKGHFTTINTLVYVTYVSIVTSYRDSERVDIVVNVEHSDHTFIKWERKDVPVIIQDKIPTASAEFTSTEEPYGVPTVDATEKGGAKGATHSYR